MTINCNWCTLKVNNDRMYALMCLCAPSGGEHLQVTEQMVKDFLQAQEIVYGVNDAAITAMLEQVMYGQYICVAQGKKATKGVDGHFDYKKNTEDMKKKPIIQEDGTADYKNSLKLATILEGELLAEYIPPTNGETGMDIFGKIVPALGKGKELLPLRGKGIRQDDDKIHYYAEHSGHIVMDGNHIHIDKLYTVNGNLDIEVGNIIFDGDVEICGDVRSGLKIEAKGNIFIHGHVGGCILNSESDITIEKGIQGRDICAITAKGNVACKFIERCTIKAGGNIYADSVLNANLIANNKVIVTSKTGNVVSSEIYGMTGVIVKEAGNSAGASALLRAGLPREEYIKAQNLTKAILEIDEKLASFNQHLENLELSKLPPEKKAETRMSIMRAKIVLDSNKNEYSEELKALNERIAMDANNSFINVTGVVYEGVRIYIGASPYLVTEALREVTFRIGANGVLATELIPLDIPR